MESSDRRGAVAMGDEHISKSKSELKSEWRGFESRWFYQSGFEFAKTPILRLYLTTSVAVLLVVR